MTGKNQAKKTDPYCNITWNIFMMCFLNTLTYSVNYNKILPDAPCDLFRFIECIHIALSSQWIADIAMAILNIILPT